MKQIISLPKVNRICSLFFVVLGIVSVALCFPDIRFLYKLEIALLFGNTVLLLFPLSYNRTAGASILSFVSFFVFTFLFLLYQTDLINPEFCILAALLMLLSDYSFRACTRLKCIKAMFRSKAAWNALEEYVSLIFMVSCLSTILFSMILSKLSLFVAGKCVSCVILSLLFGIQYSGRYTNRLILIPSDRETAIKDIINGNLRLSPELSADEDARMSALYSKVVNYMDEHRPYLDDRFEISSFSQLMLSNRTYLSKTINYFSGRNFKQFVNYYRVSYSVSLMRKDPKLSVMELAMMSGFHSVVSYNMAFRLNMNDTPANYKKQLELES